LISTQVTPAGEVPHVRAAVRRITRAITVPPEHVPYEIRGRRPVDDVPRQPGALRLGLGVAEAKQDESSALVPEKW